MNLNGERPISPRVVATHGVYEDTCYVADRGFALRAIDTAGMLIAFAVVRTASEYHREVQRLWAILECASRTRRSTRSSPSSAPPDLRLVPRENSAPDGSEV